MSEPNEEQVELARSYCVFATLVAMPVWWFIFVLFATGDEFTDSPAGLGFVGCIVVAFATPAIIANVFLVAPSLFTCSFEVTSRKGIYFVHGSTLVTYSGLWFGIESFLGEGTSAWVSLFLVLSIFYVPPMIVGSLVYSHILAQELNAKEVP